MLNDFKLVFFTKIRESNELFEFFLPRLFHIIQFMSLKRRKSISAVQKAYQRYNRIDLKKELLYTDALNVLEAGFSIKNVDMGISKTIKPSQSDVSQDAYNSNLSKIFNPNTLNLKDYEFSHPLNFCLIFIPQKQFAIKCL